MPKITAFKHNQGPNGDRVQVFVDNNFCCSIRERTFPAMGLAVGQEITCERIVELEKFHFKNVYGQSWEQEKVRLQKVKQLIESLEPKVIVNVVGFGADTTEYINAHPEESGKPDIEVVLKDFPDKVVMAVEVTGTEHRRGEDYWVRPDKLEYARNHEDQDVWIILHFNKPSELFVFIKPNSERHYQFEEEVIRGTTEHFVKFSNKDLEVVNRTAFAAHLTQCVRSALSAL